MSHVPPRPGPCLAFSLLVLVTGLLTSPTAMAQVPLSGKVNITGSAAFGASSIDFAPAGGTNGVFFVDPFTQSGTFVIVASTNGLIRDLGGAGASFLVFVTQPAWSFTLVTIGPGAFGSADCGAAPAAGQVCTPATGLPYNFVNVAAGTRISSTVSLRFAGTAQNVTAPSDFSGILTTQFPVPYQTVLATMAGGGTMTAAWSAEFNVVPQAVVP
jgi:hypothetical protein